MKKSISVLLALCLALSLCGPALAAGDLDVTKDTQLTGLRNIYNNVTVRSGATLSMYNWRPDAPGLEISGSLTVEAGGAVTGGSLIFERGATCEGMDLYYVVAGVEKPLTVTLAEVVASDPNDDYRPTFLYDLNAGHYVLIADFSNDPFEIPQPGDGGGVDPRLEQAAEKLKSLGLFRGSDLGFELDRAPTRVEMIVMLIRLLGVEDAALSGMWTHPFTDVPAWADKYIGYAWENKLTNGVDPANGVFGTAGATVQMFETFVLRAMGYSDADGEDFTWDHPETLGETLGIVLGPGDVTGFNRGTCVKIMEIALRNAMKDGTKLWEKLAADGAFTEAEYRAAFG